VHSSETFYGFDVPLEAALFSVIVEMLKMMHAVNNSPDQAIQNRFDVDYA
jgi:hypothetical protein